MTRPANASTLDRAVADSKLLTIDALLFLRLVSSVSASELRRRSEAQLAVRAVAKFGEGDWSATDRALQQATPWQVARLKASWFGDRLVYDLCCGIGGDALAVVRRGPVVAVDQDAEVVVHARHNLAQIPAADAKVLCVDVTELEFPADASIHIDPDRRSSSGRTVKPQAYQPPWEQVLRIVSSADAAVIKLAPAARIADLEYHRCWISLQGTVREQSLLMGQTIDRAALANSPRSAAMITGAGNVTWYHPANDLHEPTIEPVTEPPRFLIDPDAAIRAAGLTETFAAEFSLRLLGEPSGLLGADSVSPAVSQRAVNGEVLWWGTADDRKLRRELQARNVFPQTMKVRGTDHDPNVLTKRYRRCGDNPVTLWIGRWRQRVFAAMTPP